MTEHKHAFTIKRSEWTAGTYRRDASVSQTGQAQFCAIGAYERSLGISPRDIGSVLPGKYAQRLVDQDAAWLVCPQLYSSQPANLNISKLATRIISVNDRDTILDARKERDLIRLFAEHNVTLTFED